MLPQLSFSPLERIDHPAAIAAGVKLYCKRDDQYTLVTGTALQGNKVRKLWPFLTSVVDQPKATLLFSFGGAYSNHVAALAAAVERFGLQAVAFIRGEEVDNPMLRDAERKGLRLIRLTRSEYRQRNDPNWLATKQAELASKYQLPLSAVRCIPEGGTTLEGVISAGEAYRETVTQLGKAPDFFCLSAGTGGTAAGIIRAAGTQSRVEVYPALKGNWMADEIGKWLDESQAVNWACVPGNAFGGYGKFPQEWIVPDAGLAKLADLGEPGLPPLEPVYTAKLFAGVLDRIGLGGYARSSTVVVLHTGGIY